MSKKEIVKKKKGKAVKKAKRPTSLVPRRTYDLVADLAPNHSNPSQFIHPTNIRVKQHIEKK